MDVLSAVAEEGGSYVITLSVTDENGTVVTPNSITWTLRNESYVVVNSRSSVTATPSTSISVVCYGNDLKLSDGNERIIVFNGKYNSSLGTSLPFKYSAMFYISDTIGETS